MTIVAPKSADELPDQDSYRASCRSWISSNLIHRGGPAERRDQHDYDTSLIPDNRAIQRKLYEAGYAGITYPVEYGGQGLPSIYEAIFHEEAQNYFLPDFGPLLGTTWHVNVPTIIAHGNPEFLREFIPTVLAGEALVCQFYSEPSGGSDLAGARTRAVRDGDRWILNGQKIWSTFAAFADWGLCLARTDLDAPKHRGLTWFMVPCRAPGVTIRPIRQLDGKSSFCEDFFDDVSLPDLYRVGDVNDGWAVAQTMLSLERGGWRTDEAYIFEGPGPMAPDLLAVGHNAGRLGDPVVRQMLARGHTLDFIGEALSRRIALAARAGDIDPGIAAYAKLFHGTYSPIRARIGVEIGGLGAMTWRPGDEHARAVSIAYLNGRIQSIAGGTNEMQRNAIGERVLGLPRETSVDTLRPFREVLNEARNWSPIRI